MKTEPYRRYDSLPRKGTAQVTIKYFDGKKLQDLKHASVPSAKVLPAIN